MGEEFTATPVSALNFIENQDRSCFAASFAEFLHKFGGWYLDTAYTLYSFNDNSACVSFRQFLFHRFHIVEREIGDMTVIVDRGDNGRIVGRFYRQRRPSVKRLIERYDFGTSVIEGSQLQSVFVRFGSTVNQKQAVVFVTGNLAQSFAYLLLELVDDGV